MYTGNTLIKGESRKKCEWPLLLRRAWRYQRVIKIRKMDRGRRGRDRMVVGFTITCATSAYHH